MISSVVCKSLSVKSLVMAGTGDLFSIAEQLAKF